jgi:hypothetical protein
VLVDGVISLLNSSQLSVHLVFPLQSALFQVLDYLQFVLDAGGPLISLAVLILLNLVEDLNFCILSIALMNNSVHLLSEL